MRTYGILGLTMIFLLLTSAALAQTGGSYDLTWSAVTGGGGASSGSDGAGRTYAVTNAVAQPVVAELRSDQYVLQGGFLGGVTSPATLVLLYINGDNDLANYVHDLVAKVHTGAANPNIVTFMVLDWPGGGNSFRYLVDKNGATTCNFRQDHTCDGRYVDG
jgi:hypothetical protein